MILKSILRLVTFAWNLYSDLWLLFISFYWWKNLFIDFVISLSVSINLKSESYDSILVMINCLIKIVYYKRVKVTINRLGQAKVIISVIVRYSGIFKSIVIDLSSLFISQFWFLRYYFLNIKKRLSIVFYSRPDQETKQYNKGITQNICELRIKQLGKATTHNWVCK